MSEYQIHQWNQIIDSTNVLRPIFTFVPDTQFLDYILNNSGTILLHVEGTGLYDGKQYGTCTSSYDFPNFGPTYYETTQQYVMVLHTSFITYPFENGSFTLSNTIRRPKNVNKITQPYTLQITPAPELHEYFTEDEITKKPTSKFIIFLIITLCLLFVVLLLFHYIR